VFAPENIQHEIPQGFKHGLSDLAGVSDEVEIIDAADWPAYTRRELGRLNEDGEGDAAEPYAFYGIITPTHALACELKAKVAAAGPPSSSVF
jgi:hypothetical protein